MVGWFDSVEKENALRYGGFDELVINKLDALSMDQGWEEKLKICTAYRFPDGKLTTSVPRSEEIRQTLEPVYEAILTDGKRTLGRSLPTTNSPKTPRFTCTEW